MSFETVDDEWKVATTASHVYFVAGPLSQWFRHPMTGTVPGRDGFLRFSTAEQYMMAGKAALFGDDEALDAILAAKDPKTQKEWGRKVRNFDPAVWDGKARDIVTEGNRLKFSQNADLGAYLLATGDKTLVEGAWYDAVWGVKLAWSDPAILDEANWQGTNWLGQCLMTVRGELRRDLVQRLKQK